jgi:hypothetical protein
MSDFDPYQQWLGIQPHERPADHYRLLGLSRFEANPIVIQSAADQRMALVRVYQVGTRASYTQRLLNELAAAKLCLLNPYSKAEYDSSLSATTMAETAPVADAMLPASMPSAFVQSAPSPESPTNPEPPGLVVLASRRGLKATGSKLPIMAWMLGAIVIAAMIWWAKMNLDPGSTDGNRADNKAENAEVAVVPAVGDEGRQAHDPGLISQEASGFVIFPMEAATLRGQTALETLDIGNFLVGWQTENLDGVEQAHDIRARDRLVEDEFYLAVKSGGEHTLTFLVRDLPESATFGLKLLEFSIPRIGHTAN